MTGVERAEKVADRNNALRVAYVAAFFGILSTIVTAVVSVASINSIRRQSETQIRATADQAKNDFLRTQRQVAYTLYLNNYNNLDQLVLREGVTPTPATLPTCETLVLEAKALDALAESYTAVFLVGSLPVRVALNALNDTHPTRANINATCAVDGTTQTLFAAITVGDTKTARANFAESAQKDLGG